MKNIDFKYGSILVLSLLLAFFIIQGTTGCSGGNQLPEEVCDIGGVVCDIGDYICENVPVPEPVCTYLNLACINLEILCTSEPGSEDYNAAKSSLDEINLNLNRWLNAQKQSDNDIQGMNQ